MPQFELNLMQPKPFRGLVRARSKQEALVSYLPTNEAPFPEIQEPTDLQGWQAITLDQEIIGFIRDHNRMRFRRD
ncbi:MAG TPA: hypothetical protein PLL64_12120 [Rhodothermales bacterium]|nr:hypothetical protein [Rhodothermales bacterium]HRR08647.1 hypothetical protein [Rhodothermales bacterium]